MSSPPPVGLPTGRVPDGGAFDLGHVTALVTGASSGIGCCIAEVFASLGARVAVAGRRAGVLRELVASIDERYGEGTALALPGDLTEDGVPERWVAEVVERFGSLSCLVNNAGILVKGSTLDMSDADWDRQMDVNVRGLFRLTRAAAPALVDTAAQDTARAPSVLNLASITGTRPYANLLGYCASKAAVVMMTECMSMDLAPRGVRVNGLNPGVVRSELHTANAGVPDYQAFLERSAATHPIGRHGEPPDVAWAAAFLTSREAGWITGMNMPVDGGRQNTSLR